MENNFKIEDTPTKHVVEIHFGGDKPAKAKIITDKITAEYDAEGENVSSLGDLELKKNGGDHGGKITGIKVFDDSVIIWTEGSSCYWYWNGRRWIWR